MARIYISYRRDDTRIPALALHGAIKARFPNITVFLDALDIPTGVDFQQFIDQQITQSDIMLVVIGYNWLGADAIGRAIDSASDYVRSEIEQALAGPKFAAGKTVVPVLVNGAPMPPANKLPVSLQVLTSLQAIPFSEQNPTAALDALEPIISSVHGQAPTAVVPPSSPTLPTPVAKPAAPQASMQARSQPLAQAQPARKRRRSRPLVVIALIAVIGLVFVTQLLLINTPMLRDAGSPPGTGTALPGTAPPSTTLSATHIAPAQPPPSPSDPATTVDNESLTARVVDTVSNFTASLNADPLRMTGVIVGVLVGLILVIVLNARRRAAAKLRSVFLSYQRTSGAMAVAWLSEGLDKQGIEAFYDGEMTGKAGHFPSRLRTEIETRDVFVCVLAESTLQSEWVQQEIRFAYALSKPMIPVFLESYRKPEPITDPAIKVLLENQGEHLLDQRGIHLDYSLTSIASMIKSNPRSRVRRRKIVEPATASA